MIIVCTATKLTSGVNQKQDGYQSQLMLSNTKMALKHPKLGVTVAESH